VAVREYTSDFLDGKTVDASKPTTTSQPPGEQNARVSFYIFKETVWYMPCSRS
jgi:hypothetical protein